MNECELNDSALYPQFQCPGYKYACHMLLHVWHCMLSFNINCGYGFATNIILSKANKIKIAQTNLDVIDKKCTEVQV